MTKQVRIENADGNTAVKVVVIVQDQDEHGNWRDVDRRDLPNPADLSSGLYLTSSRRLLVIEEPNAK
jgi:hypothetical protein